MVSSGQNVSAVLAFCSIAFSGSMPLQAQLVSLHQSNTRSCSQSLSACSLDQAK